MNRKIFVVATVVGFAIIIGIIGFSGQIIINDVSEGSIIQISEQKSTGVKPLIVDLEKLDIEYMDEKFTTLNLRLAISNPNYKSVILQFVKYEIIESGSRIHSGQSVRLPDVQVISRYKVDNFQLLCGCCNKVKGIGLFVGFMHAVQLG